MKNIIIVLTAFLLLACQPNVVVNSSDEARINTVSVSGFAEKEIAPDQLEIYIAIETLAPNAQDSQKQNTDLSNRVMNALKAAGIQEDKLESTSYRIFEDKEWDRVEEKIVSRGYKTVHQIKITSEDVKKAGELADVAVQNGANRVDQIEFTLSDKLKAHIREQLLQEAAVNAKVKAKVLAESLNAGLGKVQTISEFQYEVTPQRSYDYAVKMEMAEAASPQISPEKVQTNIRISVTFGLA